ncbi:MAG: hypothetical protein L0Y76_11515, partial [Ignavibacteria bacterium]|nr:hypothetical protein [Ignavibacteria bacterium]
MKVHKVLFSLMLILTGFVLLALIAGCNNNPADQNELSDDEYIQYVVSSGYDNDITNEDNLMMQEYGDLNDGGAVPDNEIDPPLTPFDSLKRWGRKITDVNRNFNIISEGDSLKNVEITTTFTGNFIIKGYIGGILDSVAKPYSEVLKRKAVFKRIDNTPFPRRNWRLYKVSQLDGETTQPQVGSSLVQITKVEIYKNNSPTPTYVFNGPDFTNNVFITKRFSGEGIPVLDRNDQATVKIYTTSQLAETDYVAFHWAKNAFGFHRIPFTLESQSGNGPYYRIYAKTF